MTDDFLPYVRGPLNKFCDPSGPTPMLSELGARKNCLGLAADIFPEANDKLNYADYGWLGAEAFWDSLVSHNDFTLVPKCFQKTVIGPRNVAAAYTVQLKVEAKEGEVAVRLGSFESNTSSVAANVTKDTPELKLTKPFPGLRLTHASAAYLTQFQDSHGTLRDGLVAESNDIMLVMHINLDSTNNPPVDHETGSLTFVWANRRLFLQLSPPFLTLISGGGTLNPEIIKTAVYFTDGGGPYLSCGGTRQECNESGENITEEATFRAAEKEAKLAQIYHQLDLAFRPMGNSNSGVQEYQNLLVGDLVRVTYKEGDWMRGAVDYMKLSRKHRFNSDYELVCDGDCATLPTDRVEAAFGEDYGFFGSGLAIVVLSFVVAAFVSCGCLCQMEKTFSQRIKKWGERQQLFFESGMIGAINPEDRIGDTEKRHWNWKFLSLRVPMMVCNHNIPLCGAHMIPLLALLLSYFQERNSTHRRGYCCVQMVSGLHDS